MVDGRWCMVNGIWHMLYGIWYMRHGIWYVVYGIWHMIYGMWYMYDMCAGQEAEVPTVRDHVQDQQLRLQKLMYA
jgi:hypothetical protein